mmetsp:Transcript_28175/g.81463  ORF Transcript_28175/g.81463 Transcript_28175/m.81463 type:complete len:209 (-) Transcript_28175:82-708(-)
MRRLGVIPSAGTTDDGMATALVHRVGQHPLQKLRAVNARLQQRRARTGPVVLAEAGPRRSDLTDVTAGNDLAYALHGGEEARPNAVDEQQLLGRRQLQHLPGGIGIRGHALLAQDGLAVVQGQLGIVRVAEGRSRDVHDVDVGIGARRLVRRMAAGDRPPVGEAVGRRLRPGADGHHLRGGELKEDLRHVGGDGARAEDGPSDGAGRR